MKLILQGRKIFKDISGIPIRFRTYPSESKARVAYEHFTGVRLSASAARK